MLYESEYVEASGKVSRQHEGDANFRIVVGTISGTSKLP